MLESVDKDINEIIKTVSYVRKLCRYMKDIKKYMHLMSKINFTRPTECAPPNVKPM